MGTIRLSTKRWVSFSPPPGSPNTVSLHQHTPSPGDPADLTSSDLSNHVSPLPLTSRLPVFFCFVSSSLWKKNSSCLSPGYNSPCLPLEISFVRQNLSLLIPDWIFIWQLPSPDQATFQKPKSSHVHSTSPFKTLSFKQWPREKPGFRSPAHKASGPWHIPSYHLGPEGLHAPPPQSRHGLSSRMPFFLPGTLVTLLWGMSSVKPLLNPSKLCPEAELTGDFPTIPPHVTCLSDNLPGFALFFMCAVSPSLWAFPEQGLCNYSPSNPNTQPLTQRGHLQNTVG